MQKNSSNVTESKSKSTSKRVTLRFMFTFTGWMIFAASTAASLIKSTVVSMGCSTMFEGLSSSGTMALVVVLFLRISRAEDEEGDASMVLVLLVLIFRFSLMG